MFNLAPLLLLFPLAGLLFNIAFGRKFGERGPGVIASLAAGAAFVVAVLQAVALAGHPEGATVPLFDWIAIPGGEAAPALRVPWAIQVDTLSATMMLVVTGVGTLIHIYAVEYMHADVRLNGDPSRYTRFFVYLNLFLASMLVLVAGNSYLTLFVGWELVGLCSFLLIGFWFEKGAEGIGNALAAKKAFVVNRVGDFGFLIGLLLIFWYFGSLNFEDVFPMAEAVNEHTPWVLTAITLFLLVGATGKSAQIPLYVWLPDAMAGPTPVSALIHAATMVTAGIYLITRSAALYDLAPASQMAVTLVGAATALFAGTIAVGQFDIKRVLAYSTISQLGFMIAAVGLGAYIAGMFHLVTHAFFKALLFLSSGSVIHGVEHGQHALGHAEGHGGGGDGHGGHGQPHGAAPTGAAFDPQDMRSMGGLRGRMRLTFWVYVIGALALAGVFPLAGFWSKDEIVADAFLVGIAEGHWQGTAAYLLLTLAAFFTAFYMGRQIFMVFFGPGRTGAADHAVESPPTMTVPLVILAILATVGGALNLPGLHTFATWLEHTNEEFHAGEFNLLVAGISTAVALLAIGAAYAVYGRKPMTAGETDPLQARLGGLFDALHNKWWVDEFYAAAVLRPYIALSAFLADVVDGRFWHDWFHDSLIARGFNGFTRLLSEGVDVGFIDTLANGLAELTKGLAGRWSRYQTGFVRNYALAVLGGVVLILGYLLIVR